MHGLKYVWITCAPLAWLVTVTFDAAWQKIFSPAPAIGFLAQAAQLEASLRAGTAAGPAGAVRTLIFNARLDAVVCAVLLLLVTAILVDSMRIWIGILRGVREARLSESPFVLSRLRAEEL
jgi:carbon starvation protein